LADGVAPAGQFEESAFVDPPWLIERPDSGYVHVTPLIYRVAELCDGTNTYEDIARKLGEAGTPVRVDTVQRLVGQLLIPRGLVAATDGSVVEVSQGRALSRINIRTKEISPDRIDPVTNVLRWLYWPPVMAVLLLAAALAEGWLYFVHGIAGGLRDALSYPGLMLAILLFVVVAAAFHELGHAAALRYAGQPVNGMGAGLYLVYPAFYTDVTNNYRLRRWPRLRTDLGGFYFNLIFVLGVMGAYLYTGQEFLLLVVLMINFEIVHQLLPFLRLDGYWALADITGVPDFLSQMGAFVRSVIPGLRLPGQKMPRLKWWGKAAFASYMLVSVPLMGFLLFVLVRAAPRAFATAYQSALNQAHGVLAAQATGNVLGMASAAGQLLLLAIPTIGLAYTLILLAKRLLRIIWMWSLPSWPRRIGGGLATAGLAALLVWLWLPSLPTGSASQAQAGPAYAAAAANFRPIDQHDQGTVQEAIAQPWWGTDSQPVADSPAPAASRARRPAGTASPAASVTASASPQASTSASPQTSSTAQALTPAPSTGGQTSACDPNTTSCSPSLAPAFIPNATSTPAPQPQATPRPVVSSNPTAAPAASGTPRAAGSATSTPASTP
jgi:putative peptide zinc metalloprotease protein